MQIGKRDSRAILNSLVGGVVPQRGLEYIAIGREKEMKQIKEELAQVKSGNMFAVKFFIGDYGTGKSFMQAYIKQEGFKMGFAVANADFTPNRRLYGNNGQALALYSELMKNLSTISAPNGNALGIILDQWIADVQNKVARELGYGQIDVGNSGFVKEVEKKIERIVASMDELTGGYDFARVLAIYFRSFLEGNVELQRSALRWIRGEYTTKTDSRLNLGVREIINDSNYYGHLKVIAKFIRQIGYAGLIINFDEAVNLYKINHHQARRRNYEIILNMYNDVLQGNVEGLYITFSGTPQFLEDEKKGIYSYRALKRRLKPGLEDEEYQDLRQPVINLRPISPNENLVLLLNLRDIHAANYNYTPSVTDEETKNFLKKFYERPGAQEFIILGDVIRQFISRLNILHDNPNIDREKLFGKIDLKEQELAEMGAKSLPLAGSLGRFKRGNY